MDELLLATLRSLPIGVIVVDDGGCVRAWNAPAEAFIAAVGRPTLYEGMTMEDAHAEKHHPAVGAMIRRLASGGEPPHKTVSAKDGSGRSFDVAYHGLTSESGEYLGVAQVIRELA